MKKLTFKDGVLIVASLFFAIQIGGCTDDAVCSTATIEKVLKT